MSNPHSWIDEIIIILKMFGGHATLKEIYEAVEERGVMDLTKAKSYKTTIRSAIYRNTSDGEDGRQDTKNDIFFSVNGPREGSWGLRENLKPTETSLDYTEDDIGFPEGKKMLKMHIKKRT